MNVIYAYKKIDENKIVYVGQSVEINTRHKQHMLYDPYNPNTKEYNYPLSQGVRKYGDQAYELIILEENIPLSKLDEREIFWIDYYDTYYHGYNQTKGGSSPNKSIYDDELIHNIIIMLQDNKLSLTEIAQKTGLSLTHIYNINIGERRPQPNLHYPIRPANTKGTRGQKFDQQEILSIHEDLLQTNLDFKTLAKKYNCCKETISKINTGIRNCYRLEGYEYPLRKHPHSNAKKMYWENNK